MPLGKWVQENLPKAKWVAYAYNGQRFVDLETRLDVEGNGKETYFRLQFQVKPSKVEVLDLSFDHVKQSSFVKRGLLSKLCQYRASN